MSNREVMSLQDVKSRGVNKVETQEGKKTAGAFRKILPGQGEELDRVPTQEELVRAWQEGRKSKNEPVAEVQRSIHEIDGVWTDDIFSEEIVEVELLRGIVIDGVRYTSAVIVEPTTLAEQKTTQKGNKFTLELLLSVITSLKSPNGSVLEDRDRIREAFSLTSDRANARNTVLSEQDSVVLMFAMSQALRGNKFSMKVICKAISADGKECRAKSKGIFFFDRFLNEKGDPKFYGTDRFCVEMPSGRLYHCIVPSWNEYMDIESQDELLARVIVGTTYKGKRVDLGGYEAAKQNVKKIPLSHKNQVRAQLIDITGYQETLLEHECPVCKHVNKFNLDLGQARFLASSKASPE